MTDLVWFCPGNDPHCHPRNRCADGCRYVPVEQLPPPPSDTNESGQR